jgi:hypothetical protein
MIDSCRLTSTPLVATCAILACVAGCSSTAASPAGSSAQEMATLAQPILDAEGASYAFSIPSSLDGIDSWQLYTTPDGALFAGVAGTAVRAEVAVVTTHGQTGLVTYALAPDLGVDPQTAVDAVGRDMQAAAASLPDPGAASTMSLHRQSDGTDASDGTPCIDGVRTLACLYGVKLVVGGAEYLLCPETLGLGCIAGAFVLGWGAAYVGCDTAGLVDPNLLSDLESCAADGVPDACQSMPLPDGGEGNPLLTNASTVLLCSGTPVL